MCKILRLRKLHIVTKSLAAVNACTIPAAGLFFIGGIRKWDL